MLNRFLPRLLFAATLIALMGMVRTVSAQDTIGFGGSGISGIPQNNTVNAGDTILFGAYVCNYSAAAYNGDTIQINGYVDTGAVVHNYFTTPPVPSVYLNSWDSIFFLFPIDFRDNFQGGIFRIGNNTIVIWPALYDPNFTTGDSIRFNIFVIDTINGIEPGHEFDNDVRCYPVPGTGPLYIMSSNPNLRPVKAVVRDMTGQTVLISNNPTAGIPMEAWMNGIYFIEIFFDNGTTGIYKIMR